MRRRTSRTLTGVTAGPGRVPSSGWRDSLHDVPPPDEPRAATVTDTKGRKVVLLVRIWENKITRDHPELVSHLDAVVDAVAKPDHVEPDALPDRTRCYRRDVGPSRWLMAVVSYEQEPARIITALANRKDPKQWKP
jgi:hypothetical protein